MSATYEERIEAAAKKADEQWEWAGTQDLRFDSYVRNIINAALGDTVLYRIVEDDPEYGEYRDLSENKHQSLPDGVLRWYPSQHHVYASPDGYLVPLKGADDDS